MPRDFLVRFIRLSALRIMQHKRPKSWCSKIHWNESTLYCHVFICFHVSIDCPDVFWKWLMLALILCSHSQISQTLRHCARKPPLQVYLLISNLEGVETEYRERERVFVHRNKLLSQFGEHVKRPLWAPCTCCKAEIERQKGTKYRQVPTISPSQNRQVRPFPGNGPRADLLGRHFPKSHELHTQVHSISQWSFEMIRYIYRYI